jgi:hypothetical protein
MGGLVVSPGKGLLWYLPLVFLLPFAARDFSRRHPSIAYFFLALIVLPILFYSNILYWHGDPAWGPRYLYTAVPYLILPLGEILARWRSARIQLRSLVIALVLVSFGLNLAAVSVTQWRFWYRLMVVQQRSADASRWTGVPFYWGAQHYHYYWTPRLSPILYQVDDVYQVLRLQLLHEQRYLLTAKPDPYIATNPADNYSLNTLAYWWTDARHPLLGPHARAALAAGLAAVLAFCLLALALRFRHPRGSPRRAMPEMESAALQRVG